MLGQRTKKGTLDIGSLSREHVIEFHNVYFRYPNCEQYVLRNVSVKIQSGERLSVVGYNGAGKSTFVKLICRLYEPTKGIITYNGVDISKLRYDQYRKLISIVFQDFNIYSLSVRENICLSFNPDAQALRSAVEQSGLVNKIYQLSEGMDTQVGREFDENGVEFSGGEGQKVGLCKSIC